VSAVLLVVTVLFTRYQTAIYDEGFMRSMIPQHFEGGPDMREPETGRPGDSAAGQGDHREPAAGDQPDEPDTRAEIEILASRVPCDRTRSVDEAGPA
jgi:hypothetical protein